MRTEKLAHEIEKTGKTRQVEEEEDVRHKRSIDETKFFAEPILYKGSYGRASESRLHCLKFGPFSIANNRALAESIHRKRDQLSSV